MAETPLTGSNMSTRTRLSVLFITTPVLAFVLVGGFMGSAAAGDTEIQNLRVFNDVVSLIVNNYVEEVQPDEYFKDKRVHFTQTLEVASADAQRECVIAGLGIAMLTRHAVNLELATGVLRELPVEELPLYRSWCVVQSKAKRQSPVALAFLAFIRSERALISALVERFSGKLLPTPARP